MKLRLLLALFAAILLPAAAYTAHAADYQTRHDSIVNTLRAELGSLRRSADSIPVLYNLLDLSTTLSDQRRYSDALYATATRAGDIGVQLDALRHKANYNSQNDTVLESIAHLLDTFHETEGVRENRLFVTILRYTLQATAQRSLANAHTLNELFNDYHAGAASSLEDSVKIMWGICSYMLRASKAQLVDEYVDSLARVVRKLDPDVYRNKVVERLFLTRASFSAASKGDYPRAARFSARLLEIVDSLQDALHARGRVYANYDYARYTCYRRLLGNFHALSPEKIHEYYDSINAIAERNPMSRQNIAGNRRADIFYAMGTGRHEIARELILNTIGRRENASFRIAMLNWLIECNRELGDVDGELQASRMLNEELIQRIHTNFDEDQKARRLITGADSYRFQLMTQQQQQLESRKRTHNIVLTGVIVALAILLLLLILLFFSNRKMRKMSRTLEEANKKLRTERDRMRHAQQQLVLARDEAKSADQMKTDFINNMSHEVQQPLNAIAEYTELIIECMPKDTARYLTKYAENVTFNVQHIMKLMRDVLDVAVLENDKVRINKESVSVQDICNTAIMTLLENGKSNKSGIEVIFNPSHKADVDIVTDKSRLVQVIMNLMANAEKFTEAGSITVDYDFNPREPRTIAISVTDTGCGIPAGSEEIIFQRFRQLDPSVPGVGLGLYIVRRMVSLLGGKIAVDTSYNKGARMVITLPTGLED